MVSPASSPPLFPYADTTPLRLGVYNNVDVKSMVGKNIDDPVSITKAEGFEKYLKSKTGEAQRTVDEIEEAFYNKWPEKFKADLKGNLP